MPPIRFQISASDEFNGAVIFLKGKPHTVGTDHPNWDKISPLLQIGKDVDEDMLLGLIHPIVEATKLTRLSERITILGTTIYLDGDPVESAINDYVVKAVSEGDSLKQKWQNLVAFLEKLFTNPSAESREHLWHFVNKHGITIADDGDLIFYKGVEGDLKSKSSGYGIVDGEIFENAKLPNKVGSTVWIPRSKVNTNRSVACSVGLHVGNFRYANDFKGYGGRLLIVKVNPRDVVSVPNDSNDEKVRVCRYVVIEENTGQRFDSTRFTFTNTIAEKVIDGPVDVVEGPAPEPESPEPVIAVEETIAEHDDGEDPDADFAPAEPVEWLAEPELVERPVPLTPPGPVTTLSGEPLSIPANDRVRQTVAMINDTIAEQQGISLPSQQGKRGNTLLSFEERVVKLMGDIPILQANGINLKRHRNKVVTRANRAPFDEALKRLGLSL